MDTLLKVLGGIIVIYGAKSLIQGLLVKWAFHVTDKKIELLTQELNKKHEQTEKEKKDYEDAKKEFDDFVAGLGASEQWRVRKNGSGGGSSSDN